MGGSQSTLGLGDLSSLTIFAVQAVERFRRDAEVVSHDGGTKAFVNTFKTELTMVGESLEECASTLELGAGSARDLALAFLDELEQLCEWPFPSRRNGHPTSGFDPAWYPGLYRLLSADGLDAQSNIRKVARDPKAEKFRKQLRLSLRAFSSPGQTLRGMSLSEIPTSGDIKNDTPDHQAFVRSLYETLSVHCLCRCPEGWGYTMANLRLNWFFEEKDALCFGLLFRDHLASASPEDNFRWQDTQISVVKKRKVAFKDTQDSGSSEEDEDETRIREFCNFIARKDHAQLKLSASEIGLKYSSLEVPQRRFVTDEPSVSLARLITSHELTHKMKGLLSFFLAKSVWQFYNSDWMAEVWNKDTVHFMCEHSPKSSSKVIFIDEPFLKALFEGKPEAEEDNSKKSLSSKSNPVITTHMYPKILALGVMLLEIELGRPIPVGDFCEGPGDELSITDIHLAASYILKDEDQWPPSDIFKPIKEVIEICVAPNKDLLGVDSKEVRHNFFEHVVVALGEWLQISWGNPKDQKITPIGPPAEVSTPLRAVEPVEPIAHPEPESAQIPTPPITPPGTSDKIVYQSMHDHPKTPIFVQGYIEPVLGVYKASTPLGMPFPAPTMQPRGSSTNATSRSWFKMLDELNYALDIKDSRRDKHSAPVKIAILDTGVSSDYYESIRPWIRGYEDFVGGGDRNPKDTSASQHGTNSARIALMVYPEAEIYIGRVFETNEAGPHTADLMAEAIKTATEDWKVDVIAMPSGFKLDNEGIHSAITKANHAGILIFTSPSNSGNTDSVAFPGRLYKNGKVFCMFATTTEVKPWRSNPAVVPNATYNFAILGSDVEIPTIREPLHGTSVSTVIGAALAARILDFSQHWDVRDRIKEMANRLRRVEGMSEVFVKMVDGPDYGYHCMAPWKLLPAQHQEMSKSQVREEISGEILHALRNTYKSRG